MGVTIDSLQIEIQSNSINASKSIDALAASLGNLKKQTISKTAISNLEQFSNVIKNFSNVHGASNALRTLANSIERLKSVGTVTTLTKSLTGLPAALRSLEGINLTGISAQAERLAVAVAPLSNIKAGGLGSMVTAMGKLEKVTKSLSNEAIGAFAEKVKMLDDALGPVSQKMATLQAGFKGLNTAVKATTRSIAENNAEVNTGMFNFANLTTVLSGVIGVFQRVAQGFANIVDSATQWDGIAARFGKGFGSQAQETYEWIQRLNEEMGINVQQFMQYSSIYATMLTGFGVANEDAGKMALGYAELTYDIWAGYNDIYRTFDEAAEAVRSAIAGEVEPVRRAGFTIIESTLQQTAANHGLEISLENATEAQKSYLRYLTLVDQAHSQNLVGTYAKEMGTAEGQMRTLSQQLKSLAQAFGSLFIPMLVKALPYVQAFVELLTEGVHWLANLFGIKIQDISGTWGDYNSGISDAVENTQGVTGALDDATKAAKALKNASIGIDELNVISEPSSASGSGSGGAGGGAGGGGFDGLDVDSLWDESIFDSIQSKVDGIKSKLKGIFDDWLPAIQVIGTALAGWGIASLLGQLGDALKLGDDFAAKVTNIKKLAATAIIITLQFKLMEDAFGNFMGEDGTILDYIEGVLIGAASTYLLYKQWGVGGLAIGLGVTAAVSLKTVIDEGGITDMESAVVALTGLAAALGAVATGISALSKAWSTLKGSGFVIGLIEFFQAVKQNAPDVGWLAALFPKLSTALAGIPAAFSSATAALAAAGPWIALAAAVVGGIVLAFVDYDFTEIGYTIGSKLGAAIRNTGIWLGEVGKAIGDGLMSALTWVKDALDIEDFWDVLKILFVPGELIRRIRPELETLFSKVNEEIDKKLENLRGNINEFFEGFFDGFTEELGLDITWAKEFGKIFDIGYFDIVMAIVNPFSLGDNIMTGIKNGIDKSETLSAIKDKISKMWTEAKTWWDTNKPSLGAYTPSIGDIKTKLSSAWTEAKNWWDKNRGSLSTYTPSIGKIASNLYNRWVEAKDWWNKSRSNLSYTPSIGKIASNLYNRWVEARDWWNKSRSSLSYTPSIGSISTKLSSAWTSAKNWWNKSKGSLSYTPSIGSIKDKIVSAWNTAKTWWKNNVSGLSTKLNISIPKIEIKWDTVSALGKSFKYPTGFKLTYAADGGIFDQGSLIWAGERGPEVVANAAGGKTGVMNVEQMQDAVYEGVFAAITAAMSGKSEGGTQAVNVYLDGRQITTAVEQRQRERGASLMGNEVYSY